MLRSFVRNADAAPPVIGGTDITYDTAVELRRMVNGSAIHHFSSDWRRAAFTFQDTESPFPFGLISQRNIDEACCDVIHLFTDVQNGTRGVVMCVQAFTIKRLAFKSDTKEETYRRNLMRPNKHQQTEALVFALTEMLWRAGQQRGATVCLTQGVPCFVNTIDYKNDGLTEKLTLFSFKAREDVMMFIKRHIAHFQMPGGCILFLYSLVLSRTFDGIRRDHGGADTNIQLLSTMEYCTIALINLALTGRASAHLHNGDIIYSASGDILAHPLLGVSERSEIGLLLFNKDEHKDRRTQVGSMLKTPRRPVWLTHVNGTCTGVLFSVKSDLLTDWRSEHNFTVRYYTGLPQQSKDVTLTVDTRTSRPPPVKSKFRPDEEKRIPSLEQLIMTKWPGASIDWNGTSPFV